MADIIDTVAAALDAVYGALREYVRDMEAELATAKAENERLRAEPERSLGYIYESLTRQPWDASRGPLTANCLWIEIGKWIEQARADERERCAAQCRSVAEEYRDLYACHLNQERQYIARKCANAILSTRPYAEFRAELTAEGKLREDIKARPRRWQKWIEKLVASELAYGVRALLDRGLF